MDISHVIAVLVGGVFVCYLSYSCTLDLAKSHSEPLNRGLSYFLCVVFVFVGSIILAGMLSSGVEVGDSPEYGGEVATVAVPPSSAAAERLMAEHFFLTMLFPGLLGVRFALGPKGKDSQ